MGELDFNVDFSDSRVAQEPDDKPIMTPAMAQRWINSAVSKADSSAGIMSTSLPDGLSPDDLTLDRLYELTTDCQNSLSKTIAINKIIRRAVNSNDLIGLAVDVVTSLANSDIRISFNELKGGKKIANRLERAKEIISDFNDQVNISRLIRNTMVDTYVSGTTIQVLREQNGKWSVTRFPLGVAYLAGYYQNNRPVVVIDMDKLKAAITHTILRNRKGKALFYDDVLTEIEDVFGPEIRQAYQQKDKYCRLPVDHTGVVFNGQLGGLYGISPISKALAPMLLLEAQRNADFANAQASKKLLIVQTMRKEAYDRNEEASFELQSYNHQNLAKAFKQKNCLVTTGPSVESVQYVSPKQIDSESVAKREAVYEGQILAALGISFLVPSTSMSATTSKISFQVLNRQLDRIAEGISDMLQNFYRTVLEFNGFTGEYVPTVKIVSTDLLSTEERRELAKLLYGTLGASRDTVFHVLGFNANDETIKRRIENDAGLDEIFKPYAISYNQPAESEDVGRPSGNDDEGRADYDEIYNESR